MSFATVSDHAERIWFWRTDDNTWKLFDVIDAMEIRRAEMMGQNTVSLFEGRYLLNFSKQVQINQMTGFQRDIKCAPASSLWLWKDDGGDDGFSISWSAYDLEDGEKLTTALLRGEDSVMLEKGAMVYFVDIHNRVQMNIDTGRSREIHQGKPPEYDLLQPIPITEPPPMEPHTSHGSIPSKDYASSPGNAIPVAYANDSNIPNHIHQSSSLPPNTAILIDDNGSSRDGPCLDHEYHYEHDHVGSVSACGDDDVPTTISVPDNTSEGSDVEDHTEISDDANDDDDEVELHNNNGNSDTGKSPPTFQRDNDDEELMKVTLREKPEYICQICKCIMREPVLTWNGETYDRSCVEKWFRESNHDFVTGEILRSDQKRLITNYAFKHLIEAWKEGRYQSNKSS